MTAPAPSPQPGRDEELTRRRKAESDARWATEISELKTEGRTPRHFRPNPHDA